MKNFPEIDELNQMSNLKAELGASLKKFEKSQAERVNNYMSTDLYFPTLKNYDYMLSFYSFPTDEDELVLAKYVFSNNEDDVFKVKIGSTLENAKDVLIGLGYMEEDKSFVKGKVL